MKPARKKPSPPPKSRRRVWLFRGFALLAPVIALAALEVLLRVCGYGYATSYFIPWRVAGTNYFVPNDKFTRRFFPPALARTPLPLRVAAEKPPGTYRIFLFGESAAEGDPDPTFGMGRYLETLLRARFPETRFEVVCVAMPAIDSHVILPIARECARLQGDLWIVYMGNNEMIGPFGAATVFGPQAPPLWLVHLSLAARQFRVGQLLANALPGRAPPIWAGMQMFEQNKLSANDPRRLRAYEHFQANLHAMLDTAEAAGTPTLLCTVASSLRDCAPFLSEHRPGLAEAERAEWEQCVNQGIAAESASNFPGAAPFYARAEAIDPEFADVRYHIGLRALAAGDVTNALAELTAARDMDALAFRADSRVNAIIREEAGRRAGSVHLFDTIAALAGASPRGIPGREVFYEHVHLNFVGNYTVARGLAEQVAAQLPASLRQRESAAWLSGDACDEALAVSPWDRLRVWQENYSRVSVPPFSSQLNAPARAAFYQDKLRALQAEMTPEGQAKARQGYTKALARTPDDWFLHGNFARFLEYIGDDTGAVAERRRAHELLPYSPEPLFQIGRLSARLKLRAKAKGALTEATQLDDSFAPAWVELGELAANDAQPTEAAGDFKRALRANPASIEALLDLGFLAQNQDRTDEAKAFYDQAAKLQPNGPPAFFAKAIAASATDTAEALKDFHNAVWMNPQFWQAHYLFGRQLATAGHAAEAAEQFQAVVALRPDFGPATEALAKLGAK